MLHQIQLCLTFWVRGDSNIIIVSDIKAMCQLWLKLAMTIGLKQRDYISHCSPQIEGPYIRLDKKTSWSLAAIGLQLCKCEKLDNFSLLLNLIYDDPWPRHVNFDLIDIWKLTCLWPNFVLPLDLALKGPKRYSQNRTCALKCQF